MGDIALDEEIIYTKDNAKSEFDKGNYYVAQKIYLKLWEDTKRKNSYYLSRYGMALRKNGESIVFVNLCDELSKSGNFPFDEWICSSLCWCLYDSIIKDYSYDNKDNFITFLQRANYIIDHCRQLNADEHYKNPYVMTVKKVVKVYNDRASVNYKEIIKWLSFLNPDILSEEEYNFQDEKGKDRELASLKEFYYQHMAKAFEKTELYDNCIKICMTAFNNITKFHYRNDTWLKARMYYSRCMVNPDIDNAIKEYKELAYKESYWFMFHKLSQICFRFNKMSDALLYACKAYERKFEYEKMVNLLLDTALLWQSQGNNENAKLYFQASAFYRKQQAWSIPEELNYNIMIHQLDIDKRPNTSLLLDIAKSYVTSIEGATKNNKGIVKKIFSHGGSGFITPSDNSGDIYFNMNDVLGKVLLENDNVEYELAKGKDNKLKAIKIRKRGKNG